MEFKDTIVVDLQADRLPRVKAGIVPIAGAGDGDGSIRHSCILLWFIGLKPSRGRTPWGPKMSEAMHGAAVQHVLTK